MRNGGQPLPCKSECERFLNTIPKPIDYITFFATPYRHYTFELIDAFGVIYPIMLEIAFTATIFLLCDKILIIRGPLNLF